MMRRDERKIALRRAVYTRVSTDSGLEQDFNSLDNQREASEAYVKSQAEWEMKASTSAKLMSFSLPVSLQTYGGSAQPAVPLSSPMGKTQLGENLNYGRTQWKPMTTSARSANVIQTQLSTP